jgi:TonB family protein
MKVVAQLLLTFLLNASWQIALVVAFAAGCDWLLRGTAARYRHGLWVVALLLSLALPALTCSRLLKTLMIVKGPQLQVSAAPIGFTSTYSPELDSTETSASKNPGGPPPVEGLSRTLLGAPIRVKWSVAEVLMLIYSLLLLYRGSQLFRAWRRTRRIIQSAHEFAFLEPVQTIIQKCQTAIGVDRVRFLCSNSVPVPITVGILRQLIILPERLLHGVDEEVLTSAIGHELVHVARRDYLVNLVYEFIYLPLSFHPAAALVRRRIKQTRELCCDESVAKKLLGAEIYARSLVRLVGSAPISRRLAANTTIGINESDILEVRIMSLLNSTKLTTRRKRVLLIAAALLLATPCVAATSFALNFDIDRQEPSVTLSQQADQKLEQENQERAREELKRAAQELKERIRVAPESQRADAEAKLREVQENLELHERTLQQYDQQKREADEKKLQELRETLTQMEKNQPVDEARMKELRQELAKIEGQYTADAASVREAEEKLLAQISQSSGDRKAKIIYRVEPEYPEDARAKKIEGTVLLGFTIDHDGLPQGIQVKRPLYPSLDQSAIEAVRKWRFEPALKGGQPVSMWVTVEVYFALDSRSKEELEKRAAEEREELTNKVDGQIYETRRSREREEQGQEERARRQADLTRGATLSMDRAIQIATSQVPGKVLACSLGRDGDKLFYHVAIISGEGDKSTATYVWVSATDGQILKTEKEERREKEESSTEPEQRAAISGGVLNGKATSLPPPVYPAIAKQAHASGAVTVEVTIGENGNVVAAHAVSGHPLLQAAAVAAARQASFAPTRLSGEPVKVAGVLIYNFAAQ